MARPQPATTTISLLIFQLTLFGPDGMWSDASSRVHTATRCPPRPAGPHCVNAIVTI